MRLQIAGTVPLLFILPFKHIAVFGLVIECTLRKNAVPCNEITRAHQHSPFWQANASSSCRFSPAYLFLLRASWMYDDSWHFWVKPHYVAWQTCQISIIQPYNVGKYPSETAPQVYFLYGRAEGQRDWTTVNGPNGDSFRGTPKIRMKPWFFKGIQKCQL